MVVSSGSARGARGQLAMDPNKFRVVYVDSTMQPTVPAWVSWYRRVRPAPERGFTVAPRARAPARLAVYTSVFNSPDDRNLHLIRLEDMLDNLYQQRSPPAPASEWLKRLNNNAEGLWQFAPDPSKLHRKKVLDYQQRFHNYPPLNVVVPPGGSINSVSNSHSLGGLSRNSQSPHSPGGGNTGGTVWGGWAAGALLLGLLVLVVRATEKCLDRRLFKNRRRQSEEWPTPNVMATSLQHNNGDVGSLPRLDEAEFSQSQRNSDLPPPYSECALKNNTVIQKTFNNLNSEEPPPPYSDCLVAFSNKDIPTVHIHRRRMLDEPHTSSEIDNVHNDLIETRHRVDVEETFDDSTMRVELVFDNGRIVERTIDIDSTDNVPEIVANVGETVIGNGSVDDSITGNNSRESVIFV